VGRKRIAELFADHEHLVGLKVWDNLACTSGKVVAVAIEQHRPVITVRFPKTGPTKLLVVGHRPLKQKAYETIRLAPGEDYGRYRWLDRDAEHGGRGRWFESGVPIEPPVAAVVFAGC
jgi:hypothetical protein